MYLLQQSVAVKGAFHIISGYRSPATNKQLSAKSSGVAKKSLHMQGKAIDIRLPGTSLKHLRKAAIALQSGGVGYYPKSNFIHVDTGRVRYLFGGVVKGIGDYGNCVGIPNIGGEVHFDRGYEGNPIVNAMCLGLMKHDELITAVAEGAYDFYEKPVDTDTLNKAAGEVFGEISGRRAGRQRRYWPLAAAAAWPRQCCPAGPPRWY